MKKGIHYWALPKNLSLDEKLCLAKNAGFEGIELTLLQEGDLRPDCSDEELRAIRKRLEDTDMQLVDVASTINWRYSVTSDNAEIRDKAKEHIRLQIDIAKKLGADSILALPGFVGLEFQSKDILGGNSISYGYDPSTEVIDYDIAYTRAIEAFSELAAYAKDNKIQICIENIWNKFLLSPLEMRNFIDEIGSPWVGIYFDVGNVMLYGYPEQWIKILDNRIKRVHFKDFLRGSARTSGFVNLLSGDVDFVSVMRALHSMDYHGWVTAEINACHQFSGHTVFSCADALHRILQA